MNKYHVHRPDCKFDLAPLDVCDCIEKNMEDEIITLRRRLAESDKTSDEHLNARYLAERRADKAEAALTEARARLKAADRMAEEIRKYLHGGHPVRELAKVLKAYDCTGDRT